MLVSWRSPPPPTADRDRYLLLSAAGVWLHALCFLAFARIQGAHALIFAIILAVTQPLTFLLPLAVPLFLLRRMAKPSAAFTLPAIALFAAVHLLIAGDRTLYSMYSFHVNGFVWNLVTTRGGIDSLGASSSSHVVIGAAVFFFLVLQTALVWLARRLRFTVSRKTVVRAVAALAVLVAVEKLDYGWSRFRLKASVLAVAEVYPFYLRLDLSRPRPGPWVSSGADTTRGFPFPMRDCGPATLSRPSSGGRTFRCATSFGWSLNPGARTCWIRKSCPRPGRSPDERPGLHATTAGETAPGPGCSRCSTGCRDRTGLFSPTSTAAPC